MPAMMPITAMMAIMIASPVMAITSHRRTCHNRRQHGTQKEKRCEFFHLFLRLRKNASNPGVMVIWLSNLDKIKANYALFRGIMNRRKKAHPRQKAQSPFNTNEPMK